MMNATTNKFRHQQQSTIKDNEHRHQCSSFSLSLLLFLPDYLISTCRCFSSSSHPHEDPFFHPIEKLFSLSWESSSDLIAIEIMKNCSNQENQFGFCWHFSSIRWWSMSKSLEWRNWEMNENEKISFDCSSMNKIWIRSLIDWKEKSIKRRKTLFIHHSNERWTHSFCMKKRWRKWRWLPSLIQ